MRRMGSALAALALAATPVLAKWTETKAERIAVAGSVLTVEAAPGWNRWSRKPVKQEEVWSLDGPLLNKLELYGGVATREPLAHEWNKSREPLPKFRDEMVATDVAELIERTIRITEHAPDFTQEMVEPASFAGKPGFRIRYRYVVGELVRRGEARGAVVDGKLYLIAYSAPALYYFDADLARAVAIMESARIG